MAGKEVRIYKIINGHRIGKTIEINPTFAVTFLGSPNTTKFDVDGKTYSYVDVVQFTSGEYVYRAYSSDAAYQEVTSRFFVAGGDTYVE